MRTSQTEPLVGPALSVPQVVEEVLTSARPLESYRFSQDGFESRRPLFDAATVADLRACLRALEEEAVPASRHILYTHTPPTSAMPDLSTLMTQWLNPHRRVGPTSTRGAVEQLRAHVCELLGTQAVLFQDVLMYKRPEHKVFPWHQDFPFWPVDQPSGVVVWIPLDPVEASVGGLQLAVGSHRLPVGPSIDLHSGLPQLGSDGPLMSSESQTIVSPGLDPGDAILFHPLTWHQSPINQQGRLRRVWASTWLTPNVRWSHARAPRHPLCSRVQDGAPVSELPGL